MLFEVMGFYFQIKVADLRMDHKNRGKSTAGNKTDLTERFQAALIGKTVILLIK